MRTVAFFSLLLLIACGAQGQETTWRLISSLPVERLDQISLDNRDNVFYADQEGNVYKVDDEGMVSNSYSPLLQARLDQLDASSTLTLFLFSSDLQQVVLLDAKLNPINVHPLQQEEIGIVKAATLGNNNVFWLFDEVDLSLKKYDYRRHVLLQKQELSLLLGHNPIEVYEIRERQNMVFMNIKNQGVFIFDNQGNYIRRLPVLFEQPMSIHKDYLYYVKEENIRRVNLFSGKETPYAKPDGLEQNIMVGHSKIILYSSNLLQIYEHSRFD